MYKLSVRDVNTEDEQILEFESAELAILYRDYHLAFGQWNSTVKWVEEKSLTPEQKRFIVDEKTEFIDGVIVRFYKLAEGMEIQLEEVFGDSLAGCWRMLRANRNKMLEMTDWTQLADVEMSTEERKDYRKYRSYLRALPRLYDDASIIRAKVYSFSEWKKGKR